MVNYRRARIPGATYFFTTTIRNRGSNLLIEHIDALRDSFDKVKEESPFDIDGVVVLPDHVHTICCSEAWICDLSHDVGMVVDSPIHSCRFNTGKLGG